MPLSRQSQLYIKYFFLNILVATAYFATAKFGLALSGTIKQVTLIWPPTGISLAAILLWGPGVIPAITLGAFLANITTHETVNLATAIAIGNALEAVTGSLLLRKFGFKSVLDNAKSVFLFVVFGALLSPVVSASIGTASLIYNGIGSWSNFWGVWVTWWLGDFMGAMLVTPVLLAWRNRMGPSPTLRLMLESLLITILLVATTMLIFFPVFPTASNYPVEYLIFPILIWTAFRFGQKGTTLTTVLIASIAIWTTVSGHGPFAMSGNLQISLLTLQFFLGVLSLTSMVLSSVIEEKSTAQREKEYEEKKFRSLIENSADVFSLIDKNATVFYTSPSVAKVLGYDASEFVGTNIFQYIYPEDRDRLMQLFRDILLVPHKTITAEYRSLTKRGSLKWMEGTGTNLLGEPGVNGIAISYHDIDERKKLDVVKTEFVTLAAHQLRTPLTTMKWYTEALRDLVESKTKVAEYVDAVYLSILKMSELASLMLDVSRIELGTFSDKFEEVDIKSVVDSVIRELKLESSQKKLQVGVEYLSTTPLFIANPKLLRIIIQNLLGNAVHYTGEGGQVKVTVKLEKNQLQIEVKDTGIGIPHDVQSKIFTKLFRADNSKRVSPDGTGLGLYLVKSLLDKEKGNIWFTSEENKGTTFYVTLPITLTKGGINAKQPT